VRALSHYAFLHRRVIILVALAASVAAIALAASILDAVKPYDFEDPSTDSAKAYAELEEATGEQPVPGVLALVKTGGDPASREARNLVEATAERLEGIPGIARASRPVPESDLTSDDGSLVMIEATLEAGVEDPAEVGEAAEDAFAENPGVTLGGPAVAQAQINETTATDLRRIELFAAPILFLITFLVFRSLVASLLPVLVGALSITFTVAVLRLLADTIAIDIFALNVITALGFGLAIDYSLFMVSRFRDELQRQPSVHEALNETLRRTGPMICFSAVIVASAVAALAIFPQQFLYSVGVGGALVALLSAAVVLLVLPAVLAALGPRINAGSPRWLQRRGPNTKRWRRLGHWVTKRPLLMALTVTAVMLAAGLPFLRVELTRADAKTLPTDSSARAVDASLDKHFNVNPTSSVIVVLPRGTAPRPEAFLKLDGIAGVETVVGPQRAGGYDVFEARTMGDPYADDGLERIEDVRRLEWDEHALVAGSSAELYDQRESLRDHLPWAVMVILLTTVIALFVMTRSVLLPLMAIVMNVLTVAAAFGVLVLVFQDGRFEDALSYSSRGALDTSLPVLLFAVVFGLSTDYGVFLLSRVSEARRGGWDDRESIEIGLERTGRIITAAALLFAVAMGAFVFSQMIFIKEVAVGTALAVLIDATLVRALLFPALMQLGGRATWWGPWQRKEAPGGKEAVRP
jgi:uncharacterized membrane protein YdfJ with MMPL/SSD domain